MTTEQTLFDLRSPPRPIPAAEPPLSHNSDLITSYDAAEQLRRAGRLAAQQQAVLEALRQCDGATHAELGAFMDVHWLTPVRRLPELERVGLVRKGETRICRVKGSKCRTWWATKAE